MTAGKNNEELAEQFKKRINEIAAFSIEYRFWGAEFLDDLTYAVINFAEATVGLLTLGRFYPSWTYNLDPIIWKFFRRNRR